MSGTLKPQGLMLFSLFPSTRSMEQSETSQRQKMRPNTISWTECSQRQSADAIYPDKRYYTTPITSGTRIAAQYMWRERAIRRIKAFAALKPNWDTYGAPPPSGESIRASFSFADTLFEHGIIEPTIVPSPAGGIQFEWFASGFSLEIEILDSGEIDVLCGTPSGEQEIQLGSISQVLDKKELLPAFNSLKRREHGTI